jgi:murein DD-endopeptidase MepM/ murein hydrolase activator NlpD
MYAHMCPGCRAVQAGDYVEKGQIIGGMGQTGWATGVHLHFSVWQGEPYKPGSTTINPIILY